MFVCVSADVLSVLVSGAEMRGHDTNMIRYCRYMPGKDIQHSGIILVRLSTIHIASLHKGGKKVMSKQNCKPIAVTFPVLKIFENVCRKMMTDHVESNIIHNPRQDRVRAGRPCVTTARPI